MPNKEGVFVIQKFSALMIGIGGALTLGVGRELSSFREDAFCDIIIKDKRNIKGK